MGMFALAVMSTPAEATAYPMGTFLSIKPTAGASHFCGDTNYYDYHDVVADGYLRMSPQLAQSYINSGATVTLLAYGADVVYDDYLGTLGSTSTLWTASDGLHWEFTSTVSTGFLDEDDDLVGDSEIYVIARFQLPGQLLQSSRSREVSVHATCDVPIW